VSAAHLLLNHSGSVLLRRIDGNVGAEIARQLQLFRADIDGGNMQAHGFRILHGDVAQASDSCDDHPFAGASLRFLQTFVGRNAGAQM